jgi:hypothetical protein
MGSHVHQGELLGLARAAGIPDPVVGRVQAGRGTTEEVRRLTQMLIDQGKLSPDMAKPLQARIRDLMWTYCIGMDCAGFAQQAYLAAHGIDRARARFKGVLDENLTNPPLDKRGYVRLEPSQLRAGDLLILDPPPDESVGHALVVRDQYQMRAYEISGLLNDYPPAESFVVGGPVRVIEVQSSWGAGGVAQNGGVKREVWLYNEETKLWADVVGGQLRVGSSPYGHPMNGMYRGSDL